MGVRARYPTRASLTGFIGCLLARTSDFLSLKGHTQMILLPSTFFCDCTPAALDQYPPERDGIPTAPGKHRQNDGSPALPGAHDTRQDMQTRGHMIHKMTQTLPVGMCVQRY